MWALWPAALLLGAGASAAVAAATCTTCKKKKKKRKSPKKGAKSPHEKGDGHELVSKMPALPPAVSEPTQEPAEPTVQPSGEETCVATGAQAHTVLESCGEGEGQSGESPAPGADAAAMPAEADGGDNAQPPPIREPASAGPHTRSRKEKSTQASGGKKRQAHADAPIKPAAPAGRNVIEMPPGSRKTPFWKQREKGRVPADEFRAATAKDDFPTNAVTALSHKVKTEPNRDKEDIVVVRTFRRGKATFGCGYRTDDGKVHATFASVDGSPVEMKMFQVLQLRPAELQYAWKPYMRRDTDGYAPVHANNVAPAVVITHSGRTLLGEVDLEKECARAACRQTSRAVAKDQLQHCVYVLCKRNKCDT